MYRLDIGESDHCCCTSDPGNMLLVFFNKMNCLSSPRCKFKTNATRPGKQIKHTYRLKIDTVIKDIKKPFPGKIGRRPCFQSGYRINNPSLIFTSDYSQL